MRIKKRQSWYPSGDEELLLKAALWNQEEALQAWDSWVAHNNMGKAGNRLYPLGALVYHNLKDKIREPYTDKLKGIGRFIWFKNQLLFSKIKPILKAIEKEKIPILLLKGATLALGYYENIGLRTMEDIDIFVPRQEAMRVMGIVEKCGWKRFNIWRLFGEELIRKRHSVGFSNGKGQAMDLHWEGLWCSYKSNVDDWLWQAAQDFIFEGVPVKILTPSDQFFHVCIHGAQRQAWINSQDIKWIPDAMRIIKGSSLDWDRVIELCRDSRVTLQMKEAVNYLYFYLKAPIPAQVLEKFDGVALTRMERMHYHLMVNSEARPKMIFGIVYVGFRASYLEWLRRNYGLKEADTRNIFQLLVGFIFFLSKHLHRIPARYKNRYFTMRKR